LPQIEVLRGKLPAEVEPATRFTANHWWNNV
jgi:hypothetical protein